MLILTRKKGQSIVIGENIEITVLEIQNEQVKLGIQAPKNVHIYRKELYEEVSIENKEAVQTKSLNLDLLNKHLKK